MIKTNFSIAQKICLAGILIVMVAIFQKVFAINYIPVVPFVRISFGGCALIILSSVLLGPWFGLLIGAMSDLIGFFIFDPRMFGSMPFLQITAIYALLGFASYYVFKLVSLIKSKRIIYIVEGLIFGTIFIVVTLFFAFTNSISLYGQTYDISVLAKIVIPIFILILLSVLFITIIVIDKKRKFDATFLSIPHISFAAFILEISVILIFGSIMKAWAFSSSTFFAIFIAQLLVAFINIPINTLLISLFFKIFDRYRLLKK